MLISLAIWPNRLRWNEFRIIYDEKPLNYINNKILKNINIININHKSVKLNPYSPSSDVKKLGKNLFPLIYYSKLIPLQLNDMGMLVFSWRQSLMTNPKMIKTICGIEKYHQLKRDKSLWGKLRFTWFVVIATLRDLKK